MHGEYQINCYLFSGQVILRMPRLTPGVAVKVVSVMVSDLLKDLKGIFL